MWQRGIAYKSFGPNVTSLEGLDVESAAAMQERLEAGLGLGLRSGLGVRVGLGLGQGLGLGVGAGVGVGPLITDNSPPTPIAGDARPVGHRLPGDPITITYPTRALQ